MDIKHASACALEFFSFFLSFSFLNTQPLKVSRFYMCQASKLKRQIHFEDYATQVNGSEEQIWLFMINTLLVVSLIPRD
jgi:hypothetical protein